MARGRSFLILVVVALGLGAYIFFVESKRDPSEATATAKKDKVFSTDSSKYEEIEIKAASGETTTLKKVNGLWEIVKPESLPHWVATCRKRALPSKAAPKSSDTTKRPLVTWTRCVPRWV